MARKARRAPRKPPARRRRAKASEKREFPRAPILTQVEARWHNFTALGRAADISIGGLLVESPETIEEGSTVIVRFFVPPDIHPIEAAGRVVRSESGNSMGIAFLGLAEHHRKRIAQYVKTLPKKKRASFQPAMIPPDPSQRRSARIERRISLILSWQDKQGRNLQEGAETQLLSRYGAKVLAFTPQQPGQLVRVFAPDLNKRDISRVVWVQASPLRGRVEMALEILGDKNFWEMEFPPHEVQSPDRPKRRSARILYCTKVVLSWLDERGELQSVPAETRLLSKHGALLTTAVALLVNHPIRLRVVEDGREAEGRVVYSTPSDTPSRTDLGIEILSDDDFWRIPFPPDTEEVD